MLEELQFGFPILTFLTFFPFVGALIIWAVKDVDLIKKSALGVAVIEFFVSALLLLQFVPETAAMQFAERYQWVPALGISYHMAVDGDQHPLCRTQCVSDRVAHLVCLGHRQRTTQSLFHECAGTRNHHHGDLCFHRSDFVLCILGTHADSQLLPDKTMGNRYRTPLCGIEICALHPHGEASSCLWDLRFWISITMRSGMPIVLTCWSCSPSRFRLANKF